jgi:hypothetical protein
MTSDWEYVYWHEIWPDALLNTLHDSMENGDVQALLGLSSLAVCHRQSTDYEAAVCTLVREILRGVHEARTIQEDLKNREEELKRRGLYNTEKRRADLLGAGLVPLSRLERTLVGYRRAAREVYAALAEARLLKIEEHAPTSSSKPITWIGINANWGRLIDDIGITGKVEDMFASSLGIMLCIAVDRRGFTTVLPMARAILSAEDDNGEIDLEELRVRYRNVKALNTILERQREKIDSLKIFPSDDGKKLLVNQNTSYAVELWRKEVIRLERVRRREMGG